MSPVRPAHRLRVIQPVNNDEVNHHLQRAQLNEEDDIEDENVDVQDPEIRKHIRIRPKKDSEIMKTAKQAGARVCFASEK